MDDIISRLENEPQPMPEVLLLQQMERALNLPHSHYEAGNFRRALFDTDDGTLTVYEGYDYVENPNEVDEGYAHGRLVSVDRRIRIPGAVGFDKNGTPHVDKQNKGYFEIEYEPDNMTVRNCPQGDIGKRVVITEPDERRRYMALASMKLGDAIEATAAKQERDLIDVAPTWADAPKPVGRIRGIGRAALRRFKRQ